MGDWQRRAANLRTLRLDAGLSVAALTVRSGINQTFITDMENGRRTITLRTVDRLATALQRTPAQVLEELDR